MLRHSLWTHLDKREKCGLRLTKLILANWLWFFRFKSYFMSCNSSLWQWFVVYFGPFSTFLVHFKRFSVIFLDEINKKCLKKQCYELLFKAGRNANPGQLPEGYLKFIFFWLIFYLFNKADQNTQQWWIKSWIEPGLSVLKTFHGQCDHVQIREIRGRKGTRWWRHSQTSQN